MAEKGPGSTGRTAKKRLARAKIKPTENGIKSSKGRKVEEEEQLSKRQQAKERRKKITGIAIGVFAVIMAVDHFGLLPGMAENRWLKTGLYIIPWLMSGYDVLKKAFSGIRNGQMLDESFLMTIASCGAFVTGECGEAAAVMLFYQLGDSNPDTEPKWYEYNPDLRTEANSRAVQDALDYTSFLCGLGTHRYQFQGSAIATATQYMGDRQDMVQHANRHQIQIEEALLQIFRALLWAGRNLLGADVDPETDISINWDDSYIDTAERRRAQDTDDAPPSTAITWSGGV